ncbi:MAG: type II toxin-antitoxin system ParD family antitoxin [Planctomycetota bacterium]|nr:type II toxin-antitoxin system ParD family antitoxin [Planctomycetota bacterium]
MAKQHTLNVSLTPQLARKVAARVKGGAYASASEVVREALRALDEREAIRRAELRRLRSLLDQGEASATRDGWLGLDEVRRRVSRRGRTGRSAA